MLRNMYYKLYVIFALTDGQTNDYNICFVLEDISGRDDDLSNVPFEDDAFDELQAVLHKTMKLKTKKDSISTEKVRSISNLVLKRRKFQYKKCRNPKFRHY